jgi:hypothetical protein
VAGPGDVVGEAHVEPGRREPRDRLHDGRRAVQQHHQDGDVRGEQQGWRRGTDEQDRHEARCEQGKADVEHRLQRLHQAEGADVVRRGRAERLDAGQQGHRRGRPGEDVHHALGADHPPALVRADRHAPADGHRSAVRSSRTSDGRTADATTTWLPR